MPPVAGRLTQKDRVLRALRTTRGHGITRVDFMPPDVIDGGKPILNFPARIKQLRDEGYPIKGIGLRDDCTIYALRYEEIPLTGPEPAPEPEPAGGDVTALFDATIGKPPPAGPYDPDRDQAA